MQADVLKINNISGNGCIILKQFLPCEVCSSDSRSGKNQDVVELEKKKQQHTNKVPLVSEFLPSKPKQLLVEH